MHDATGQQVTSTKQVRTVSTQQPLILQVFHPMQSWGSVWQLLFTLAVAFQESYSLGHTLP